MEFMLQEQGRHKQTAAHVLSSVTRVCVKTQRVWRRTGVPMTNSVHSTRDPTP